eukprot:gene6654-3317_t
MQAPRGFKCLTEHVFMGRTLSQVKCLACGHCSNTYEPFAALSLELSYQTLSVEDALKLFTNAEMLDGDNKYKCEKCKSLVKARKQPVIDDEPNVYKCEKCKSLVKARKQPVIDDEPNGYKCEKCKCLVKARKQLAIDDEPNVLAIHLKRFDASGYGSKVSRPAPSGLQCTTPTLRDSAGAWHCANDSFVSPVSPQHVHSQQAYILFYGRTAIKRPSPVPKAAPEAGPEAVSAVSSRSSGEVSPRLAGPPSLLPRSVITNGAPLQASTSTTNGYSQPGNVRQNSSTSSRTAVHPAVQSKSSSTTSRISTTAKRATLPPAKRSGTPTGPSSNPHSTHNHSASNGTKPPGVAPPVPSGSSKRARSKTTDADVDDPLSSVLSRYPEECREYKVALAERLVASAAKPTAASGIPHREFLKAEMIR